MSDVKPCFCDINSFFVQISVIISLCLKSSDILNPLSRMIDVLIPLNPVSVFVCCDLDTGD